MPQAIERGVEPGAALLQSHVPGPAPEQVVPRLLESAPRFLPSCRSLDDPLRRDVRAVDDDVENLVPHVTRKAVRDESCAQAAADVVEVERRLGVEGNEREKRPAQIPQSSARSCQVPVDEDPLAVRCVHEVVGAEVVVAHDLGCAGWIGTVRPPLSPGGWLVVREGVMQLADLAEHGRQGLLILDQVPVIGVDHVSMDVGQDFVVRVVSDRARGGVADLLQVSKQVMDRGRPWSGRPLHRVASSAGAAHVPAGQRLRVGHDPIVVPTPPAANLICVAAGSRLTAVTQRRPTVHVMVGLPAAGKSSVARALAEGLPAVRFSLDEWMLTLYDLAFDHEDYARKLPGCRALLLRTATQVLTAGVDVVLDWNHWSPDTRAESASWAAEQGAEFLVHHVATSLDTSKGQARARAALGDPTSHLLDADMLEHALSYFVPPDAGEGHEVVVHRAGE